VERQLDVEKSSSPGKGERKDLELVFESAWVCRERARNDAQLREAM